MPQTLWIARHANRQDFVDPDWPKTAEQPYNPGLSPDGREQARKLAQRLAGTGIGRIIASPFLRTVQTAHAVAEALDRSVHLEPGIGEWLNAEWFPERPTILASDVLADRFDRVTLDHPPCLQPSFPETHEAMLERMKRAARCLLRRYDGAELLLVGHGATAQGVLLGLVDAVEDTTCSLASVTRLVHRNGAWQVAMHNDTAHLDGTAAADRFQ